MSGYPKSRQLQALASRVLSQWVSLPIIDNPLDVAALTDASRTSDEMGISQINLLCRR
jgi:hypothetical protein